MTTVAAKRSFISRLMRAVVGPYKAGSWLRELRNQAKPLGAPDASPLLVVVPHQDDETLGCGGLIALKRQLGAAVTVVFVTNGAASPTRGHATLEDCIALRRQEALEALAVLGVSEGSVHFLNGPDGGLESLTDADKARFENELVAIVEKTAPAQVATTFRHDVHPDHEACFRLCARTLERHDRSIELLEFPVWSLWHPCRVETPLAPDADIRNLDVSSVRALKLRALACFRSQISSSFLPRRGHVPQRLVRRLTGPGELFFVSRRGKVHGSQFTVHG